MKSRKSAVKNVEGQPAFEIFDKEKSQVTSIKNHWK